MGLRPRKVIYTRKWWKKYEYRIEQYCKIECPFCKINKRTGEAFCYGRFEKEGKHYRGNGIECYKAIDFCFDEKVRKDER